MEFRTEIELIDVTIMPQFETIHKLTGKTIPVVYRGKYWCSDCRDEHEEYTFDKRFNPKYFQEKQVGGFGREFIQGLTMFYINDIQVSKEEFESKLLTHQTPL